jgi:ribosome-associated protein
MTEKTTKKPGKRGVPEEVRLAVKAAQARKGEDIRILDLRELSSFTDFFVVMNGNSSRHIAALLEAVEDGLKASGLRPLSVEGRDSADWGLIDYGSFLVHIFSATAREHYALEKLWGDAPKLDY